MKMPSSNVGALIPDDEDLKNIHENEDEKSLRIKHENDKFFSRLLSKETSKSNPSFRVLYYGDVSSAVPFTWETRPGTPKHPSAFGQNNSSYDDIHIPPPLTPPPSYYTSHDHHLYQLYRNSSNNKKNYYSSRSKLLRTFLRRINPKKSHPIPASSPLSYSSSSSFSSHRSSFSSDPFISKPSSNGAHRRSRSCLADMRRSSTTVTVDEEFCSPSRFCLGNVGKDNRQRLHSAFILKKAFFSIIGRGST